MSSLASDSAMERYLAEQTTRAREEWMRGAMTDACGSCHTPTEPRTWSHNGESYVALYTCGSCGSGWKCGWDKSLVVNPL